MSEKKVIEQEKWDNLEINSSDYYGGFVSIETNNTIEIRIEKKHATTVAKAIDPEYQKVIDQNAKLVEALRECQVTISEIKSEDSEYNSKVFELYRRNNLLIIQALQQSKNIEG